jgi:hypothetical protein
MKLLAASLIAAAVGAPLPSSPQPSPDDEDGSVVLTIPAESVQLCAAEGGCALFTRAYIERLQQEALRCARRKEV